MTGAEHYREAERHLSQGSYMTGRGMEAQPANPALAAQHLAMAQVHATLALTAATAEQAADQQLYSEAVNFAWWQVLGPQDVVAAEIVDEAGA